MNVISSNVWSITPSTGYVYALSSWISRNRISDLLSMAVNTAEILINQLPLFRCPRHGQWHRRLRCRVEKRLSSARLVLLNEVRDDNTRPRKRYGEKEAEKE
jgi:hypothetical protein